MRRAKTELGQNKMPTYRQEKTSSQLHCFVCDSPTGPRAQEPFLPLQTALFSGPRCLITVKQAERWATYKPLAHNTASLSIRKD